MQNNKFTQLIDKTRGSINDWQLLKGSALISIGTVFGRILGFAFSIVLASVFTPGDYGSIQYSITVASTIGILSQPMGQHVLARFVGKYSKEQENLNRIASQILFLLGAFFLLSLFIAAPFLSAVGQLNTGVLIIFLGETLFYAYWGLASGTQNAGKLTALYLSSNTIQLILVFLTFNVFGSTSTMLALVIYGSSYLLPLLILQIYFPLPLKLVRTNFDRESFTDIIKFAFPKFVSHSSFSGFRALDVFLLKYFSSPEELGAYLLTRTIVSVFLFVPRGISSLLMPKVAATDDSESKTTMRQMIIISLAINILIFFFYVLLNDWAITQVFGADYILGSLTSIIMGLTAILVGLFSLINSYSVGKGRPATETYGYLIAVTITTIGGFMLVPSMDALGIAISKGVGIIGAFIPFFYREKWNPVNNNVIEKTI